MNFYESKMGQIFFEHQVPQLIRSIDALTAALGKPTQAASLSVEPNPEFLSELYYGNYEPDTFKSTEAGAKLIQELNAAYDSLIETLSDESCDKLDFYLEIAAERNTADSRLAYESGFRAAVQMILAGLSRPKGGQSNV